MMSSMYSGITGLNASTQRMAVIGDNIANVNTTAYKGSEISFESLINQSVGGYTGQEIGGGVLRGELRYDWNQGTIQRTSSPYDVAVAGNGFFVVQDNKGNNYYTRDGSFSFDSSGNLLTASGMNVRGFDAGAGETPTTPTTPAANADLTDITVDLETYKDITVDSDGVVWAKEISTGEKKALFQLALADTSDRSIMAKTNNNLYVKTTAGDPSIGFAGDGTTGMGSIETSSLEMSNVDIAKEFVNMITAQRAFSANSKVITTSDEILQELVNIKR